MPQQYDPLSQEDDSQIVDDSPHVGVGLLPRPAIYYGDGQFNAPSSEEEDEVEEVEKAGMGPLNRAEHGSLLLGSGLTDGGLYAGGAARKVR
jgi:dipeptidyl aminopeptidase